MEPAYAITVIGPCGYRRVINQYLAATGEEYKKPQASKVCIDMPFLKVPRTYPRSLPGFVDKSQ